ncbi:MAG: hypothetical protein EHM64_03725 [Ignavibacteriae bacterium]|nr:MAG: hypothetical protein EHM64_03725 [Ignavibacteriota bacterium]
MLHEKIKSKTWNEVYYHLPILMVILVGFFTVWLNDQANPIPHKGSSEASVSPWCSWNTYQSYEKKIAEHFSNDTLPGLLQMGLFEQYQRNTAGTRISVNGKLWNERTTFFKQSLLAEVFVYNKVNGYELSTRIVDSASGKLYAQITSAAQMDFYD